MTAIDPVLAAMVDRCAELRRQVDELTAEKRALEAELVATGLDRIDGTLHSVSISRSAGRETVDWKAIAAKLEPSRQLITAYTKLGEAFNVVRYSARKLPV